MEVSRSKNSDTFYTYLTGTGKNSYASDYGQPPLSPNQAFGIMASWSVETGSPDLSQLDVVEQQARAGRGLNQYTGPRRVAYDRARAAANLAGIDTNSAKWQLQYMKEEYQGKHDPAPGKSLIGYTQALETYGRRKFSDPGDAAVAFTGSAAEGRGYLRPGVPHFEKRRAAAANWAKLYANRQKVEQLKQLPKASTSPAKAPQPVRMTNPTNLRIPTDHGDPMGLMR